MQLLNKLHSLKNVAVAVFRTVQKSRVIPHFFKSGSNKSDLVVIVVWLEMPDKIFYYTSPKISL